MDPLAPTMEPGFPTRSWWWELHTFFANEHSWLMHCFLVFIQVCQRRIWLQLPQHHPVDLHAPGHVWEVRLQRLGLPEEAHLRGHEGARGLRQHGHEVQERIPVSIHDWIHQSGSQFPADPNQTLLPFQVRQVPRGPFSARRYEGTVGRVPWCQRAICRPEGLPGLLPMPLLHQGLLQEERPRQQLVRSLLIQRRRSNIRKTNAT